MKWEQFERWGMHNVEFGTAKRKALTFAKPVAVAGLAVLGTITLASLLRKLKSGGRPS
jgi:hypothetical protein